MGLNPLDLQTMYAQINNVARDAAHLTQGAALSEAIQQQNIVKKNLEEATKVNQAKENSKSKGIDVNAEGKNQSQDGNSSDGKHKPENPYGKESENAGRIKEDYLGRHIDITR